MPHWITCLLGVGLFASIALTAEPAVQERIDAAYARMRENQAATSQPTGQTTRPAATKPVATSQTAASRPAENSQDRFAKQRRMRAAEITKEIDGLHGGIYSDIMKKFLEVELKEIRQHPENWAPPLRLEVGSVGRFYRSEVYMHQESNYVSYGAPQGNRVDIVQIVDGQNMIAKYGGSLDSPIWISGVDTSAWVDGRTVSLPGVFKVTGHKTYKTAFGSQTTVFLVEAEKADASTTVPQRP
jgi:hypothetical protein